MNEVINVENLGKKYIISHQGSANDTFREVISENAKKIFKNSLFKKSSKEEFWALKNVSFQVNQGERVGIIGRNGAGKSTLLKLLSRITEPTEGRIKIKGKIASLLEVGTGFHPELTGRENIYLNGAVLGMSRSEIKRKFDDIVEFSGVEQFLDTPVKRYSSGMYVRLAFAVAAHLETEILLIDEVLAVGDIEFQKKCLGKMEEVSTSEGRTVIFVSHNMETIENLCERCILLESGRVNMNDETKKVINYYIENIMAKYCDSTPISERTDRQGNGNIRFSYFHIEDEFGNIISTAKSGVDVVLVFGYECNDLKKYKNVDVGFSIHNIKGTTLSVLYSSYIGKLFTVNKLKGEFHFRVNKLPLPEGRYSIGARIVVNGIESDWLKNSIGFMNVKCENFYGTGNNGWKDNIILVNGEWKLI
jgi:lipopolysaccharide transport system ATP-binding protein